MAFVSIVTESDLATVRERIGRELSANRAAHVLGVEDMAVRIGEKLLPDKLQSLRLAALLHDITKEWSDDAQLAYFVEKGMPLSEDQRRTPMILHAMSGAYFARDEYPSLVDDEVFLAIYRHTTGDADMTLFQMTVYVADLIEDGRKQPFCVNLRKEFLEAVEHVGWKAALETAFLSSLRSTILSFAEKSRIIAPETLAAYNFMLFRDQEEN